MGESRRPLSSICPAWHGQLDPTAFTALLRGLERERSRFRGKPCVVVAVRHDFDTDGLCAGVALVAGFADRAAAVKCAEDSARDALASALAEPSSLGFTWRLAEVQRRTLVFKQPPTASVVTGLHCAHFKLLNGLPYDSRYYEFHALYIPCAEIVGDDLFAYIDVEAEWVTYLTKQGANT
jgi:hypothetical protein